MAYHEAGHAVASWYEHLPISEVTIVPSAEHGTAGHVLHGESPKSFRPDIASQTDARNRARVEAHARVALAGTFAERLVSRRVSAHSWSSDREHAVDMLDYLVGSHDELEAYVKLLVVQARQLVQLDYLRPAIDALATALLDRPRLSGRTARKIIRSAIEASVTHRDDT
jgi:ATP-dependent Zn protease